jgi:hypothetical protein
MASIRPRVQGKFLFVGNEKLYVRGVTYGPFRPSEDGDEYYSPEVVERDFAQIAANGLNAVRARILCRHAGSWMLHSSTASM